MSVPSLARSGDEAAAYISAKGSFKLILSFGHHQSKCSATSCSCTTGAIGCKPILPLIFWTCELVFSRCGAVVVCSISEGGSVLGTASWCSALPLDWEGWGLWAEAVGSEDLEEKSEREVVGGG